MKAPDFSGARLKVKRAHRHIDDLEALLATFLRQRPYSLTVDEDPRTGGHGINLRALPLPAETPLLIGDAVHNLRASLDLMLSQILVQAGGTEIQGKFPFHETRDNLHDGLAKHPIKKRLKPLVEFILNEIRPYDGGNTALWRLNKLDVLDKHHLLVPVLGVTELRGVSAEDEHGNSFSNFTLATLGGSVLPAIGTDTKFRITSDGEVSVDVFFAERTYFEGQPVIPTLRGLAAVVSQAIDAFEAFVGKLTEPHAPDAADRL